MGPSWLQILVVVVLVLLLFGRGKIASLMKEVAQGIRGFRKGLEEDSTDAAPPLESKREADTPPKRDEKL